MEKTNYNEKNQQEEKCRIKKSRGKNMKKINWESSVPANKVKENFKPVLVSQNRQRRRERSKRKERCMQDGKIPCRKTD